MSPRVDAITNWQKLKLVAFVFVVLAPSLVLSSIAIDGFLSSQDNKPLSNGGQITDGNVVSVTTNKHQTRFTPTIEFFDLGNRSHRFVGSERSVPLSIGSKIKVSYLVKNPKVVRDLSAPGHNLSVAVGCGVVGVAYGLLVLHIVKQRRALMAKGLQRVSR